MERPLVHGSQMRYSIVMPAYNVEAYIKDAVSDIEKQSFSDFELILIDDCSTDTTGLLCDVFAHTDERIQVRHLQKNGGLSNARNQGMDAASGEYILFLDPDDRYDTDMLAKIEESLQQNPAKVVLFGLTEMYYDPNGKIEYQKQIVPVAGCFDSKENVRQQVLPLECQTLFGYAWNKAYQLSYVKEHGFRFQTITMIEDVLFNIEVFRELDSCNLIAEALYKYAIRKKGSLTTKYLPDYFELHERRVESMCQLYRDWDMETPEELKSLGSIYCRYFMSALQRNCSKAAKMSHKDRKSWVRAQFQTLTYQSLKNSLFPDNRILKVLAWGIRTEKVEFCLFCGRGIYIVKEKCPGIFSRLKQNR